MVLHPDDVTLAKLLSLGCSLLLWNEESLRPCFEAVLVLIEILFVESSAAVKR